MIKQLTPLILALCIALTLHSQNRKMVITGTVTDDDNQPAMSIAIHDKTENGELLGITDYDGNFRIEADPTTSLHFSGLTYAPKVVKLKGKQRINVTLSFDSKQLDEVIIVAKRVIDKFIADPTDIEIIGNQYIIHPKVRIPQNLFKPDSRIVVQPILSNRTRSTQSLFRPAVVTGKQYAIGLERMMEFDLTRDPLHPYCVKSTRVDQNEVIAYADSLHLDNPDDECWCDIYLYLATYRRVTYSDTVTIAKGTIYPMRFFVYNLPPRKITDDKYVPRPKKQLRGEQGQVNLTFTVNSAEIDPANPLNAVELEKMRQRLAIIDNDPNSEFLAFSITAISSPEGIYRHNLELARKRARTAKEKILHLLNPGTVIAMRDSIRMDARVDQWTDVARLMEQDTLNAAPLSDIIARYPNDPTAQSRQIARLPEHRNGITAPYLKKLRRVEYSFSYSTMRFLHDDEIRRIYDHNYRDLVEYEFWRMYLNATTPQEREKICRQALEVYPHFMMLANELAVILIDRKQPDARLLAPFISDRAPEELLCNHIIALMQQRDYVKADSVATLLRDSPIANDVKLVTGAYNGHFKAAYERFAPEGGINEVALLLALKRNEEAADKADELPDSPLAYYLRAVTANRLDRVADAFANLKKAIEADPSLKETARIDGDVTDLLQQMEEEAKEKEQAKEKENK